MPWNPYIPIVIGAAAAAILVAVVPAVRRWIVSMRTAVWLLVVVAALALAGLGIGQNLPETAYVERFGHALGLLVVRLGLHHVFSTWYFSGVLALLTLSLVSCGVVRVARTARGAHPFAPAPLGSFLTHIGMGVVLIGGLVSAVSGFSYPGARFLAPGDIMEVPEGGFSLRVEEARTEFTDEGALAEYLSIVTLLEDGSELRTERIEVNHPLFHNGIGIFQYEMLPAPDSFTTALVRAVLRDETGDTWHEEFLIAPNVTVNVPGTDITLKAVEFISDFTYDIETRTAAPASVFHRNPAVRVQVADAGDVVREQWLFVGERGHMPDADLPVRLFLLDYRPDFSTGLTRFQVSYQPGTPLMYVGFAAISLGIVLLFWFRREPATPRRTGGAGGGGGDE